MSMLVHSFRLVRKIFDNSLSFLLHGAELAIGNVVRRVLHVIREEDASLAASSDSSDYSQVSEGEESTATAVAAANRSVLRAPSLHNLLESVPGGLFSAGEDRGLYVEVEANKSKSEYASGIIGLHTVQALMHGCDFKKI